MKDGKWMTVWNIEEKPHKRIVVAEFSDGSCVAVDESHEDDFLAGGTGCCKYLFWLGCKDLPQPRPYTKLPVWLVGSKAREKSDYNMEHLITSKGHCGIKFNDLWRTDRDCFLNYELQYPDGHWGVFGVEAA